ncbi:hypothetical protein JRQ81_008319 [Phrynocephalus forsythii]|uniref:Uncharacterized protein n=1 Tax=Phrynocephalus forsythii TaxID=171643 RepID=A0A9Q0XDL2_9SAUR|nr:hypothetical protein JRQ81_008319 [Phrynocephalus forsythii]
MRNPDKTVPIPEKLTEWVPRPPPEFVRDVMAKTGRGVPEEVGEEQAGCGGTDRKAQEEAPEAEREETPSKEG